MSYYCIKCKQDITDAEYKYSEREYRKALCRKHQPSIEARKLGKILEKIGGWIVKYEDYDGHKNVDLSIPTAKVDIEVDGLQHSKTAKQALADLKRTYYSYKNDGYITLHIPNILVDEEMALSETANLINDFLKENLEDLES